MSEVFFFREVVAVRGIQKIHDAECVDVQQLFSGDNVPDFGGIFPNFAVGDTQ